MDKSWKMETPFIKLDSFLKAANLVGSGGEAKVSIQGGRVRVNGVVEARRGRKLYPGDKVAVDADTYLLTE